MSVHGGPHLAGGMNPENSEGAGPLCPPMGVAEHGSAPSAIRESWWARVALGSCSRLALGVEQAEISLIRVSDTRILETLIFGERLYVLGLGGGLRTALSKPIVGVQDRAGIKEGSTFPSTVPSGSAHTLESGYAGSQCSNSVPVLPPKRMSWATVCVSVGTGPDPCLVCQSKPGSLLQVF